MILIRQIQMNLEENLYPWSLHLETVTFASEVGLSLKGKGNCAPLDRRLETETGSMDHRRNTEEMQIQKATLNFRI